MKNTLTLTIILLAFNLVNAQTFDKSLAGIYESTSSNDWVSLKGTGTGKLYITNDFMPLGSFSFTWTSDEDQVTIIYKDQYGYEDRKWCYWVNKNGAYSLEFPTIVGTYLSFIKTR